MGEGVHTISKGVKKTDRSYQRDTEKGLNKQEAYTVNKLESQIRNRKTEKGYVIDANGRVIGESVKGTAHRAKFRKVDLKKDSIVTHNHPTEGVNSGLYGTMAGRIGVPFSSADVKAAVENDLKEIRAVTPTYTWSLRRPKGGWGDTREIMSALRSNDITGITKAQNYAWKQQTSNRRRAEEVTDRANVVTQYQGMKELAKRFGWEFTRRKVK